MSQPRLCIQTQTPLIRLLHPVAPGTRVDDLHEERDYLASPGGVTRMLRGLALRLEETGRIAPATWISLAREPARLTWGKGRVDLVSLEAADLEAYGRAKTAFWDELHELAPPDDPRLVAHGLGLLGRAIAERATELHEEDRFDLFYTHDFQLLTAGRDLPTGVPRVFRWHVPVRRISAAQREFVARALDEYDAVIVSTEAYAAELRSWGVRAPVTASYPYLDESRRRVVTDADVAAFNERHGLGADDVVFTIVARMDAIKSQDVAIRALSRIAREAPDVKLVLLGGGGFSGGRQGLGLSQATDWRARLEALAAELGVADRVIFTGGVTDAELDVAFTRARANVLPSSLEGFGLAAIEGWLYGRPAIVSEGAGVSELVRDGENGYKFAPGDDAALAAAMLLLSKDEQLAADLGAEGRLTARACHLDRGADDVWSVLRGVLDPRADWERPPRRRW